MTTTLVSDIPGLFRCESLSEAAAMQTLLKVAKQLRNQGHRENDVYTVNLHIECPPEVLYDYLLDIRSLEEYTYSTRRLRIDTTTGLWVGQDATEPETEIYMRITGNREVGTVDYESAYDQGNDLWMVYCGRILSAERVQHRPGSLVSWTIWRHPYYDKNPYPHLAPSRTRTWPGSLWPLFHALDVLELGNLKHIVEHRVRASDDRAHPQGAIT